MGKPVCPLVRAAWSCWLLVCAGCANFSETYYYATDDESVDDPIYYRVRIHGSAIFSASRYSAGMYDAHVVDDLFGEVTMGSDLERRLRQSKLEKSNSESLQAYRDAAQELAEARKSASLQYAQAVVSGQRVEAARTILDDATAAWEAAESRLRDERQRQVGGSERVLDPSGNVIDMQDKRFVMFMNTNSDALALALRRMSEEREVIESIVEVSTGPERVALKQLEGQDQKLIQVSRAIIATRDEAQERIAGIASSTAAGEVKSQLLETFNRIALFDGSPKHNDAAQAQAWLDEHAALILGRDAGAAR